jgi:uncharacterized protein YbaR (Trm112 family)
MLGRLARLVFRITLAGMIIGAVTAILGLGAIAVSEFLSRRKEDEFEEDFGDFAGGDFDSAASQELDEEFLSLLACPVCKTGVRREGEQLICDTCGRRYPIRDGIPVMLVEEAETAQASPQPTE